MIAASAGSYLAMHELLIEFNQGSVSRKTINSALDSLQQQFLC
jgi:hypothetical protein